MSQRRLLFGASGFIGAHVRGALAGDPGSTGDLPRARTGCDLLADESTSSRPCCADCGPTRSSTAPAGSPAPRPSWCRRNTLVTAKLHRRDRRRCDPAIRLVRLGSAGEYGPVPHGRAVTEDDPAAPVSDVRAEPPRRHPAGRAGQRGRAGRRRGAAGVQPDRRRACARRTCSAGRRRCSRGALAAGADVDHAGPARRRTATSSTSATWPRPWSRRRRRAALAGAGVQRRQRPGGDRARGGRAAGRRRPASPARSARRAPGRRGRRRSTGSRPTSAGPAHGARLAAGPRAGRLGQGDLGGTAGRDGGMTGELVAVTLGAARCRAPPSVMRRRRARPRHRARSGAARPARRPRSAPPSTAGWVYQLQGYPDGRLDALARAPQRLAVVDLARDARTDFFTAEEIARAARLRQDGCWRTSRSAASRSSGPSTGRCATQAPDLMLNRWADWPDEYFVRYWDQRWWDRVVAPRWTRRCGPASTASTWTRRWRTRRSTSTWSPGGAGTASAARWST